MKYIFQEGMNDVRLMNYPCGKYVTKQGNVIHYVINNYDKEVKLTFNSSIELKREGVEDFINFLEGIKIHL